MLNSGKYEYLVVRKVTKIKLFFCSIENPDRSNSFEEELFRGLPRDDVTEENDDVIISDDIKRSSGQRLSAARYELYNKEL